MHARLVSIIVLVISYSFFTSPVLAQEFDDSSETGFYGYTTIYYDPTSLNVTAYTETDLYGSAPYVYDAVAAVSSNGKSYTARSPNPSTTYADASVVYQGVAGQSYTAYGTHSAQIDPKEYGLANNDPYGTEEWDAYDIVSPMQFAFTALSPETTNIEQPIELGETYDSAEANIPSACGDSRSSIIQEYVTYKTPYYPQCYEFKQLSNDPNFSFSQLNSGTYTWAILRTYFLSNLDQLLSKSAFGINSAYRNPAKESSVSTSQGGGRYHPGSRHQYGDAVDIATNSTTWSTFQSYGHQFGACVEPIAVQGGSYAHAHLDWRTQATLGPTTASCPPRW